VGAELPSRVADDLFGLGRAVEQAEGTARLLRVVFESLSGETGDTPIREALVRALVREDHLDRETADAISAERWTGSAIAGHLTAEVVGDDRPRSLRRAIVAAALQTDKVRDRIAGDMWRTIHRLERQTADPARWTDFRTLSLIELLNLSLGELMSFTGLAAESMTRTLGWRFLDLGRRVERTLHTANLLHAFFAEGGSEEPAVIETLLKITDSLMTYRNRYLATFQVPVVLDLLVTDESNPRSILHQLATIAVHVANMPRDERVAVLPKEQRLAMEMESRVRLADVFALDRATGPGRRRGTLATLLEELAEVLPELSDALTSRYFTLTGSGRMFATLEPTVPPPTHRPAPPV